MAAENFSKTKVDLERARDGRYELQTAIASKPIDWVRVSKNLNFGPNCYACIAEGDCLSPVFNNGDVVVIDPDQAPVVGDFVCIWWRDGPRAPSIKKLAMALVPKEFCGSGALDELEALLVVKQLNPPKTFSARMSSVEAVHKVLGEAEAPHG